MTLVGNMKDEFESVKIIFVKHLHQGTSLFYFKHLQESPKV
jgi:hypothetical protein